MVVKIRHGNSNVVPHKYFFCFKMTDHHLDHHTLHITQSEAENIYRTNSSDGYFYLEKVICAHYDTISCTT